MIKTVILGGTEQEVRFDGNNTYYWVQNLSDADVLASLESGIVDGADGVLTVPSGGAGYVRDDTGAKKLYIIGTGKVQIYGTNNAFCPFKVALGGGESSSGESIIAWLPVVSPEGTISWYRSSSTIAPATQNIKGENGTTYVPSIGTVTTVDSTIEASVSVEVDEDNKQAVFNFSIPKGEKGESIPAMGEYVPVSGGTMEGALIAQSNTDYTVAQVRNVIISSEAPSGTAPEGTIWYQYEVTE